jgi:tetratricopeptide (TPR) repeat protein
MNFSIAAENNLVKRTLVSTWAWIGQKPLRSLLVLWLLVVIVYFPVLQADYVAFDEEKEILGSAEITAPLDFASLKHIFTSFTANQYTPLSIFSHWLEYNLVGFNSTFSHLVSLLLHLGAASAVFYMALSIFGSQGAALLAAAFWAIHPLQVDSVAWVLERRNLLFGMFFFASMMFYCRFTDHQTRSDLVLACICLVLSGLAKTLAFYLPFFWLLIDWIKKRPVSFSLIREKAFAWVVSAVFVCLLFTAAWDGVPKENERLLKWNNAFYAISFYAGKFLVPSGLTATFEENASTTGIFVAGSRYFVLLLTVLVLIAWQRRIAAVGAVFYLCSIIPLSGLIRVGYPFYVSCHFVYVALWGLIMSGGCVVFDIHRRTRNSFLLLLLVCWLACLALISHRHTWIWQNSITLFEHSLEIDPDGKFSRYQLAGALVKNRQLDPAEKHYEELIRRHPGFYAGYNGLGLILSNRGEYERAMQLFNQALKIEPDDAVTRRNRGMLRFAMKDPAGAEDDFSVSLQQEPENFKTRFLRAELRAREGRYALAIEDLEIIAAELPQDISPRLRLFELLLESACYYRAAVLLLDVITAEGSQPIPAHEVMTRIFYPGVTEFSPKNMSIPQLYSCKAWMVSGLIIFRSFLRFCADAIVQQAGRERRYTSRSVFRAAEHGIDLLLYFRPEELLLSGHRQETAKYQYLRISSSRKGRNESLPQTLLPAPAA